MRDRPNNSHQMSLFDVRSVYEATDAPISNEDLYRRLSVRCGIPLKNFEDKSSVGKARQPVSLLKRRVRWYQQSLKAMGVLEKTEERGVWRAAGPKGELKENTGVVSLVAFSTRLGVAIWGRCERTLEGMDEHVDLCITSPPYPLRTARAYGNPDEHQYVDFITRALEPIAKRLSPTASLCLNISNDIFASRSPARSLYKERLVLALNERLGLHKMDELIWENPCKPPGPVQWASGTRQQLNVTYEPILWFSPSPQHCKANNRRVLQPHSPRHLAYLQSGHRDQASYSDGAYKRRETSYPVTDGKIPRNILRFPHNCPDQSRYKSAARALGLPAHGAPFPLALVTFLIEFLTEQGDLVLDPFAGSITTGVAAESLGRRWLCTESMIEYVAGGACRFEGREGLWINPHLPIAV